MFTRGKGVRRFEALLSVINIVIVRMKELYLTTHVDGNAHDDDGYGDASNEGDDDWRPQQHAHLPQNLPCLRPGLLPPEGTARGTDREYKGGKSLENTPTHFIHTSS